MLSRARGLLRARAGYTLPSTGKPCVAHPTRSYAATFAKQADFDNLPREQDGHNTPSAKNRAYNRPLIRKTLSNDAKARIGEASLFAEEEQIPINEGRPSKKQSKKTGHAVSHQAASDRKVQSSRSKKPLKEHVKLPKRVHGLEGHDASSRLAFGIVTTTRPLDTSLDDLIKDIKSMPVSKARGPEEHLTKLVMLFTPGLARFALDSNVTNALYRRFCLKNTHRTCIESTSAVVDRLPAGDGNPQGSEGIAYMLFRDPPVPKEEEHTSFQESAQKPGSLTFRMPRILHGKAAPVMDYELQLPLSQTLFTTGSVSTLISRKYKLLPRFLQLSSEQKLESQTLQLPGMAAKDGVHLTTMPLVPLTPFRKINYVMGNIIRKLSSHPSWLLNNDVQRKKKLFEQPTEADGDMPASQELEDSVSRYFETLDLQPETVSVWALVVPRTLDLPQLSELHRLRIDKVLSADDKAITRAWHSETEAAALMAMGTAHAIRHLIPQGGRIIKVLSGGGGWGKKAGLLSLDPDVRYSTRELRQDEGWNFDFDGADDGGIAATEAQQNQALGQIVKQGESIMFLLAPKLDNLPEEPAAVTSNPHLMREPKHFDLTFGAIPSSIDVVSQPVTSDTGAAVIEHYPNHFGALSEGGMAVTVNTTRGTSGQSKLDVPFGKFYFRQYKPHCYLDVQSAAQVGQFQSGLVEPVTEAPQQPRSTKDIGQAPESMQRSVEESSAEESSDHQALSDMFESFAQDDDVEDVQTIPVNHMPEPKSDPTAH